MESFIIYLLDLIFHHKIEWCHIYYLLEQKILISDIYFYKNDLFYCLLWKMILNRCLEKDIFYNHLLKKINNYK